MTKDYIKLTGNMGFLDKILKMDEKIGLLSFGGSNTSESKAKKIGYITYQLFSSILRILSRKPILPVNLL